MKWNLILEGEVIDAQYMKGVIAPQFLDNHIPALQVRSQR